jgi:TFIIF-interacting CTD phosphatase-like protein
MYGPCLFCRRTAFLIFRVANLYYSTNTNRLLRNSMDHYNSIPSLPQRSWVGSQEKLTSLKTPSRLDPLASRYLASAEVSQTMADSLRHISLAGGSSPLSTSQSSQTQHSTSQQMTPAMSSPIQVIDLTEEVATVQPNTKAKRNAAGREAKVQPSQASGGIPDPSPQYLHVAQVIPRPLQNPQDLLLVIDLNGTLLYRPSKKHPTNFLSRPHAPLFLKYCIDTFKVVIWSSALHANVTAMCNAILTPELRRKVVAIWSRDKFNLSQQDFAMRVICYKRLTRVWKDPMIASTHPDYRLGGRWDQTNTVLIDDSVEKGRSEPYNLIEIPEWNGDTEDVALPQVHDHLNRLSLHSNVSGSLYAEPFKPSRRGWAPSR